MATDKPFTEAPAPPGRDAPVVTREFLESGGIADLIARAVPDQRVLTDEERRESLRCAMAQRPPGPMWLFGYGSLIWNPTIHTVERRVARVGGWHRSFCLKVRAGRGSVDRPGLVLGLDQGGECTGVAFRIAEDLLEQELELLWRREMVSGSYVPRWLDLTDPQGEPLGQALGFTMNTGCEQYAGRLPEAELVETLSTACGALGSSADYLFRTCEGLRACGVHDAHLERLAQLVALHQQRNCG